MSTHSPTQPEAISKPWRRRGPELMGHWRLEFKQPANLCLLDVGNSLGPPAAPAATSLAMRLCPSVSLCARVRVCCFFSLFLWDSRAGGRLTGKDKLDRRRTQRAVRGRHAKQNKSSELHWGRLGFKEEEGGAFMYVMGLAKRKRCWETERLYRREASFVSPILNVARSRVSGADENLSECGCNEEKGRITAYIRD